MLHIIILGIIQGIAEFLPISSSAHLIIFRDLFGIGASIPENVTMAFDIALHLGTLLAIIVFFFKDFLNMVIKGFSKGPKDKEGKLMWMIVVATIPAAIAGLLFEDIIEDWFRDKVIGNDLYSILKDLVTLNLKEFEKKFEILVRQMFSYMDVGENTAENFYHAFVLGMLVGLKDSYYVNSNRESGLGRYDIMLEPKDKNGNSFIMEFKVHKADKEQDIKETIVNAKKQIEDKKYEENLKERGFTNITKMVFAFHGKEVKMEVY